MPKNKEISRLVEAIPKNDCGNNTGGHCRKLPIHGIRYEIEFARCPYYGDETKRCSNYEPGIMETINANIRLAGDSQI